MTDVRADGVVREWHDDEGWGVVDSPATPGGCWVHYSVVAMEGYRSLAVGDVVELDVERAAQDGYRFRAVSATRSAATGPTYAQPGFASALDLRFDAPLIEPVRVIRPLDRVAADPTPGMMRELAFEAPMLWAGQGTTDPGAVSSWHHHAANHSSLYVVSGVLRLEFEGRAGHVDAVAGDFVHVPAFTVHRESNPSNEPAVAIIARAGGDTPTVNIDRAPEPHPS